MKYLIIPCYVQFKLKYILLKYIIYMHMFKGMLLLKVLIFFKGPIWIHKSNQIIGHVRRAQIKDDDVNNIKLH